MRTKDVFLVLIMNLAFGAAFISTKIGAEGLPLKNNESIFLEDNPKKFANKIISISKNNKILRKIGIKSNYVVLKNFSEKAQINDAKKLLKKL